MTEEELKEWAIDYVDYFKTSLRMRSDDISYYAGRSRQKEVMQKEIDQLRQRVKELEELYYYSGLEIIKQRNQLTSLIEAVETLLNKIEIPLTNEVQYANNRLRNLIDQIKKERED
jgi:hypothetical protein